MKELGDYLKQTRINNGVGIEEAANDLKMDLNDLENLEEGNVKAFKDILSLRRKMKEYAKYLGLDSESVADEFNDFLFEHTSRISLDDILEAEKKREENSKKIVSPYTVTKEKKKDYKSLLMIVVFILLIMLLIFVFIKINNPELPVRNTELLKKYVSEVLL